MLLIAMLTKVSWFAGNALRHWNDVWLVDTASDVLFVAVPFVAVPFFFPQPEMVTISSYGFCHIWPVFPSVAVDCAPDCMMAPRKRSVVWLSIMRDTEIAPADSPNAVTSEVSEAPIMDTSQHEPLWDHRQRPQYSP